MKRFFTKIKPIWKLVVLLLLIGITFSYAMFQGGFVSWFLFYSFIPFALYSLLLSLYKLRKIDIQRNFAKVEYHAGENLVVNIKMKRSSSFPLFYMVIGEQLSEKLAHSVNNGSTKTFVFPFFRKEISFDYRIEELPRGEHHFKGIEVEIGDPLGLFEKKLMFPTEDNKIIVYPAYEELIYRTLDNQYDQGMTASKERVQRDTTMAIGIRDYQPGDRFSWINWKATARRNEIMTKEFEQRKSHDVFIIMDCQSDSRFEIVVSFTTSVMRAILRKGAQVGLLSFGAERNVFPIRNGDAHQQEIFYSLAKVKDDSKVSLDIVLEGEGFGAWENATLMLVTAKLTKKLIEKAGFYASRKGGVTIFLIKRSDESANDLEKSLKSEAMARGVHVIFVHQGHFSDAFTEVNRR